MALTIQAKTVSLEGSLHEMSKPILSKKKKKKKKKNQQFVSAERLNTGKKLTVIRMDI